jgi:alpha-amylase
MRQVRPRAAIVRLALTVIVAACTSGPTASDEAAPTIPPASASGLTPAAPAPGSLPAPSPTVSAPPGAASGACDWAVRVDPAAAIARTPTSSAGWWRNRVFYEAFVRSFSDSDGDGIGDLRGLTARLDYLNDGDAATTSDLGVTGLWLMPVMPSPSYHGYDVTDYGSINPDYGSLADLRTLVAAAHARGIAVILDMPFNHTSSEHAWFLDAQKPGSPHDDWYVWADSPQGANWYPKGTRYYYGNFGPDFPDLNLRNRAVTTEIERDAEFWLSEVGVDGFRLDAAKHLIEDGPVTQNTPATHAWLHDFRTAIEARHPGALALGEVFDTPAVSASYVPGSLDLSFDFGLAGVYVATAATASGNALGRALARVTGLYAQGAFGAFLTNHDQDRVASQLGGDPAKLHLAAGLLLTGPGVPFVYYGEEIGMSGAKPDEQIRTPMRWDRSSPGAGFTGGTPWEPLSGDAPDVSVAAETSDPCSLLSWYRDLIALRSTHPAFSSANYATVASAPDAILAELRWTAAETLLVIANTGKSPINDAVLRLAKGPLKSGAAARGILGAGSPVAPVVNAGGGFDAYRPLDTLPPFSVSVIAMGS